MLTDLQRGMTRQQQRRQPRDVRCRHGTAIPRGVAAARHTRDDGDSRRADCHLRPPTAEIRREQAARRNDLRQSTLSMPRIGREFANFADGGNRQDTGNPGRKLYGSAGIARAHDACDALPLRCGDLLGDEFGELLAVDADLNDIEPLFDAGVQRLDEIAAVASRRHLQYMNLAARRTADDLRTGYHCPRYDAGAMRAVTQFV